MYFWRIEALKTELQSARVPEPTALKYLLATLAAISLLSEASMWMPVEPNEATLAASAAAFVISLFGTYAAYAANGGAQGVDFLARYLAVGWVVGIRVVVAWIAVFVMIGVVQAVLDPTTAAAGDVPLPGEDALTVLLVGVLYWRMAVHMRALRADPAPIWARAQIDAS